MEALVVSCRLPDLMESHCHVKLLLSSAHHLLQRSNFGTVAFHCEPSRDLLWHDDNLTLDDREKLWDLLQYVMSDPKSDLVPAKRKLIDIDLKKAASLTRELTTDLIAKYFAEMSKG